MAWDRWGRYRRCRRVRCKRGAQTLTPGPFCASELMPTGLYSVSSPSQQRRVQAEVCSTEVKACAGWTCTTYTQARTNHHQQCMHAHQGPEQCTFHLVELKGIANISLSGCSWWVHPPVPGEHACVLPASPFCSVLLEWCLNTCCCSILPECSCSVCSGNLRPCKRARTACIACDAQ